MTDIDDLSAVTGVPVTPEEQVCDDRQRLRIHVPNISTTMSLGALAASQQQRTADNGEPNFDGFGVHTVGNIWMDAAGGKENSKMNLQANGQILIQTDQDSLYMVSSAPSLLASPAASNVVGGGGVNIIGGAGSGVTNPSNTGEASGPGVPEAYSGLPGDMNDIANIWSGVDSTMAALAIAAGVLQSKLENSSSSWASAFGTWGNLAAAGCIANNEWGRWGENPTGGGVTIHGMGGWLLGTPLYGSAYAGLGLTIGSMFPAIMALMDTGIMSARNTGIASGKEISLSAGDTVSILGGKKVEISARGGGGAVMQGKTITLGSKGGVGGQQGTTRISAFSRGIALASTDVGLFLSSEKQGSLSAPTVVVSGGDSLSLTSDKATAVSGKTLDLSGNDSASLKSDKFYVTVGKSSLSLGNISSKNPPRPTYQKPDFAAMIEELGVIPPRKWVQQISMDARLAHFKKFADWAEKCKAAKAKNCSIELKDGGITLEVKGHKFSIDSSKTKAGGSLIIQK